MMTVYLVILEKIYATGLFSSLWIVCTLFFLWPSYQAFCHETLLSTPVIPYHIIQFGDAKAFS